MLSLDPSLLQNYPYLSQTEWLETNGLGGWSSSTVSGAHSRRYHGLLTAAIVPPTGRMVMVSKLEESILWEGRKYELGCNDYGGAINPIGFQYLKSFSKDLFPEWIYEAGGVTLKKTVAMVQGENTTLVRFEVLKAPGAFQLELLPLIAARDYHSLGRKNDSMHWDDEFNNGVLRHAPYGGPLEIFILAPTANYMHHPQWYFNFHYEEEKNRGLEDTEDLFNPGKLVVPMAVGDVWTVLISTENPFGKDANQLFELEALRKREIINSSSLAVAVREAPTGEMKSVLTAAADQFIVRRGADLKTVIAGYHWFTDWGRDTMIALPGLCLSTGRYEDAKKILQAFARSVSEGMLPNRFMDGGDQPEYNNVDGSLWFFVAIYKYWLQTNDHELVLEELTPVLEDMIEWHLKGTRYNIRVAEDGLLSSGEKGVQLTWMDAKVGDWVVTPRMGKPVEIQALWYNALMILSKLCEAKKNPTPALRYSDLAAKAKDSFQGRFWNEADGYWFDAIDETGVPDPSFRPNQVFLYSLPFQIGNPAKALQTLQKIEELLYTPYGLRSLSPADPHYIGFYGGDQLKRDSSYHQGTVWSWLLGPYMEAILKTDETSGRERAQQILAAFRKHLSEGGFGSISEIFDGDYPHAPKGCIAQAWSVAEILRVIAENNL